MTHGPSRFIAALLGVACSAVAFAQSSMDPQKYIGHKYWYEPEHAKFVRVEFHRVPRFDQGMVNVYKKTKFEVMSFEGVFFLVRFEHSISGTTNAYLPLRTLRSRLYVPKITESFHETFRKAAFFEEDPDVIRRRLDQPSKPAANTPAPPPAWQIRNRGPVRPGLPEAPKAEPPEPQ